MKLNKANSENWSTNHDVDALITVEVLLVTPEHADGERLQIANIQFNNLDIIGKNTSKFDEFLMVMSTFVCVCMRGCLYVCFFFSPFQLIKRPLLN